MIFTIRYLAVPPAVVMFTSAEHGVDEHVAPSAEKLCIIGGPDCTVAAAHDAVPHVKAAVISDVAEPPRRIGVTVGEPVFAKQETAVMVQSDPVSFEQEDGESLSSESTGDAAPGSPTEIVQDFTLY